MCSKKNHPESLRYLDGVDGSLNVSNYLMDKKAGAHPEVSPQMAL